MTAELRISKAILHAPAFGSERTQIGGAEEAARELAQQLHELGYLHRFATLKYQGIDHRFKPSQFIPDTSLVLASTHFTERGDALIESDHTLLKLMQAAADAANGSDIMFTHYYTASGAYHLAANGHSAPEVFFAHTWGKSVEVNNPQRKPPSELRTSIETHNATQIAQNKMLLAIQTMAEAEQLLDLYGITDPAQRQHFLDNTIITPLGVQSEFLDVGALTLENPAKRNELRAMARTRFVDHLRATGMGPEAARLALSAPSNKWIYCIGRVEPGKGHMEALEGFINALEKDPTLDASLLQIGGDYRNNPVYEAMKRRIAQLPKEAQAKIYLLDSQVDARVIPASDIGIISSRRESFSFVGAKTMAAGNGLLINRDPILMEAMGMDDALLPHPITFNPDDANELGDAILTLVTNDEYRLAQGQRNATYAQKFQWDRIAANFVTQLEQKLPHIHR